MKVTEPATVSASEYEALFGKSLVGLYVLQRGRLRYVSDPLVDLLGYESAGQLTGKAFWELVHPDDRDRVRMRKSKAESRTLPGDNTFRVLRKDHGPIRVEAQGDIALFEDRPAYVGCLIDRTTIERLDELQKKYWAMLNEVEDVVSEVDLDGNLKFFTEAALRMWNASRADVINRNFRSYMDKKSAETARQAYIQVCKTGVPGKNIVYEIIRNDGTRMVVEDSVSLIRDRDGATTGFRTVSRDITERRAAESKLAEQRTHLEAIFRSVQDAIITVAPDMRVIEANASAETLCGIDAGAIVGGMFPHCLRRCSASCGDVLHQTLENKRIIRDYRVECGIERHHPQIVSVSSSPLKDDDGTFLGAVLVMRDITLLRDLERELRQRHHYQGMVGKSKRMQDIYQLVEDLADLETTVLVTGESGTGKELIAKSLHHSGHRAFQPFIAVNCSALAESLLESELFGHVKGAFTGADQNKLGRFESADGGTILLDEIGDVSPLIQLKLLRVLQGKEFERVGDVAPRKVNVRVIACTNKDLRQKVKSGEFREDLYYRLKVVEITPPPLRERLEDIPLLVEHFRQKFNKRFRKAIEGVSSDVLARFMDYHWPGNVREFEHMIEHAFVLCDEHWIAMEHLPMEIQNHKTPAAKVVAMGNFEMDQGLQEIRDALNKTFWNKSKAAHLLGISRQTLYRKMHEYVLQRGRFSHVNAQLADILGYENPAQLIGASFWELVHPGDRGLVRLHDQRGPNRVDSHHPPFRVFKNDGSTIQAYMQGANTLYEGQPAHVGCLIDMTCVGRLEEALGKYRIMINEVDDALAEMDLEGNIIFSNTSVCRKWETLGDKTKTLNFRTYVDAKSVDAFIQAYQKVYDSGLPGKHIVYEVVLADGQRLTVEDSVSLMRDEKGTITGFRIVSRNITDRIKAEKILAEQRTQLEAIFRSVNDAIVTVDPQMKFIEANTSAESICGLNRNEIAGQRFPHSLSHCDRTCFEALRQTIEDKRSIKDYRVACGRKECPQQIVTVSSSPLLGPNAGFMGAVLVIRDITLLQDMERELWQRHQYRNIIGKSQKMRDIYRLVGKLANLDTTVLVTGESGTGKELIAKALHYSGDRANKPFVAVNCSAFSEALLESELFGHVKGAFTGAIDNRQGRFQAADGGTILLDEIGDVSPLIQVKLLRVLQEKEFHRVGENAPRKLDVRVITCTNKDLKEKMKKGEFRQDLFYRLKVVEITLPPLRERVEDIPLLADHFRRTLNSRLNKNIEGIHVDVLAHFRQYAWPGNVRELAHVIERAFVLCRGNEILTEHLPKEIIEDRPSSRIGAHTVCARGAQPVQEYIDALDLTFWNKTKAAKSLGIS
ncbi:MAG: sigma 54-interacting transcriptional regulator, partial [Desulfobacterales bacterium]|nr:sigma 54-interacting transcriptional regulator [Desulfobacterales bacterium]